MELKLKHYQLLDKLGLPRDLTNISDDEYFRIHDIVEKEAMRHMADDGNALTELGEDYIDILQYMADL